MRLADISKIEEIKKTNVGTKNSSYFSVARRDKAFVACAIVEHTGYVVRVVEAYFVGFAVNANFHDTFADGVVLSEVLQAATFSIAASREAIVANALLVHLARLVQLDGHF